MGRSRRFFSVCLILGPIVALTAQSKSRWPEVPRDGKLDLAKLAKSIDPGVTKSVFAEFEPDVRKRLFRWADRHPARQTYAKLDEQVAAKGERSNLPNPPLLVCALCHTDRTPDAPTVAVDALLGAERAAYAVSQLQGLLNWCGPWQRLRWLRQLRALGISPTEAPKLLARAQKLPAEARKLHLRLARQLLKRELERLELSGLLVRIADQFSTLERHTEALETHEAAIRTLPKLHTARRGARLAREHSPTPRRQH